MTLIRHQIQCCVRVVLNGPGTGFFLKRCFSGSLTTIIFFSECCHYQGGSCKLSCKHYKQLNFFI